MARARVAETALAGEGLQCHLSFVAIALPVMPCDDFEGTATGALGSDPYPAAQHGALRILGNLTWEHHNLLNSGDTCARRPCS